MENSYIIPAAFFRKLNKEDLENYGWQKSPLAQEYFLKGSLTDEWQSGIWIRQRDEDWIITNCNKSEHEIIHEEPLSIMELINLTQKLLKSLKN